MLKEFLNETDVNGSIIDVYFSDDDAVKFSIADSNKKCMQHLNGRNVYGRNSCRNYFMMFQTCKILEMFSDENQSQK